MNSDPLDQQRSLRVKNNNEEAAGGGVGQRTVDLHRYRRGNAICSSGDSNGQPARAGGPAIAALPRRPPDAMQAVTLRDGWQAWPTESACRGEPAIKGP
jgi:hypothetical protein